MTDNDIIKALEICNSMSIRCGNCSYYQIPRKDGKSCSEMMLDDAIELINRQKAEIELKTMDVESLTNERNALEEMVIEQKAEMDKLSQPLLLIENQTISEKEFLENIKNSKVGLIPVTNSTIRRIDEEGIRAEAINQFLQTAKERVTDKIYFKDVIPISILENVAEEMVGENK